VTLRANPIEERVALPDGRDAVVRVAVADDSYLDPRELDTVSLEIRVEGETAVVLNTVLDADQESQARELAGEVATGLRSGDLEPTGGSLEPLALERR
jgi:hypothetical protein